MFGLITVTKAMALRVLLSVLLIYLTPENWYHHPDDTPFGLVKARSVELPFMPDDEVVINCLDHR